MNYAKELRRIAECYDALLGRSDKEILLTIAEKIELNAELLVQKSQEPENSK